MATLPLRSKRQPYTGPRYTFSHPSLGSLTGRLIESSHFPDSPVVQFRSIPYATIPKRFSPSVLATDIPTNFDDRPHRDFTDYGAACPQRGAMSDTWGDSYGGWLDDEAGMVFDEFTCLTVSVSVPVGLLDKVGERGKVPVLVYVHGGGASEGIGHVDGLHSNAPITSYAASISKPVVAVNIGYRLNWLGGLVCQDMLDEYASDPSSSPHGPFNLTLQDQRTAFTWIHKFVGGFGGDESRITAFGESAGSMFLAYHICGSSTKLFDRAILQSGLVFGHVSLEVKEQEYQRLLQHFKIEGSRAAERLDALRRVDQVELAQFPGFHLVPYVGDVPGVKIEDSVFTRGMPTVTTQMELVPSRPWLGDLIIGDDFWEGDITYPTIRHCPQAYFVSVIKSYFPEPEATHLLAAYGLSQPIDHNPAGRQMSNFFGDLMFNVPNHAMAKALTTKPGRKARNVYRYHCCFSNPFPGSANSFITGHHYVEILYIFLTLLDRYPAHRDGWAKRQALETARRWITFANGEEPWEPHVLSDDDTKSSSAKIAIADDLNGWTVRTIDEDERVSKNDPWGERRYAGWKAFEAAFEALRVEGEEESVYSERVTEIRVRLIRFAFGSNFKLSEPEKSESV